MLKHPNAFLPVAMSLGALATVVIFLAMHGAAPQADEGAAAHIWQLLMAAQAPIVLYFAIRWLPAITKTSCPHPSPAGRRRISSHGACFLAALVRALSCVRGSASPSRSSVRLTVAPQPRWPERYDSLARAFNGDDNVHASAAHGLRASSIRLDLVPAIVRLDQQGSPHAGSSSVPCGAGGNVRHAGHSLSRSVTSSFGGFTRAKARPDSLPSGRPTVCSLSPRFTFGGAASDASSGAQQPPSPGDGRRRGGRIVRS
jgi:hypothetical protein